MGPISNPAIEPGNKSFVIEFVLFGTKTRPAMRRKATVMATTAGGAKRIAKARWPRSSEHTVINKKLVGNPCI